jgi:putative ABC transport system permease protein
MPTAWVSPSSPISNMRARVEQTTGLNINEFKLISSISALPVKARQVGVGSPKSELVHGADATFLRNTTYGLAAHARGYPSSASVWRALATHPGLAVVDPSMVVRKANWGSPASDLQLQGFVLEDRVFDAVPLLVRDMQTGSETTLKVIGVLSDTAPQGLTYGIWTSQSTLERVFADRVQPTSFLFKLQPGIDPRSTAKQLEKVFVTNGMQADAMAKLLDDATASSMTFNRIVMGFMGLGLIVGVAALGVITARAVVERRQQIGVLRAIGFRRRMVQLSFLIESSFIALTAIVVGTGLGLLCAWNVIGDSRRTPSWAAMSVTVPWATLGVIFLSVIVVALVTTLAPAARAARVYPAEALRYQ